MITELAKTNDLTEEPAFVLTQEDLAQFDELHENIATFAKRIFPHIHEEWVKIEPKLRAVFNQIKPDFEKAFANLEIKINEASNEVELETNTILKEIFEHFEGVLDNTSKKFLGYISENPKTQKLIQDISDSSSQIESFFSKNWHFYDFELDNIVDTIGEIDDIINFLEDDFDQKEFDKLLYFSKSDRFKEIVLSNYKITELNSNRIDLINEAIQLHCLGYYGGSITLLYSQIEGVVTDTIIDKGYAKWKNNKLIATEKANDRLLGLSTKLKYASTLFEELDELFTALLKKNLMRTPDSRTISQNRNIVLHGNYTDFAKPTYSLKLLLCLYSILLKVRLIYQN